MNGSNYDRVDVLFFSVIIIFVAFCIIKRVKEAFYPSELIGLEKDLQTTDDMIVYLERRYDKKYIDTVRCLKMIKDDLQSKIKKIKGGD